MHSRYKRSFIVPQCLQAQFSGQLEQGIGKHLFQRQAPGICDLFVKQGSGTVQLQGYLCHKRLLYHEFQ